MNENTFVVVFEVVFENIRRLNRHGVPLCGLLAGKYQKPISQLAMLRTPFCLDQFLHVDSRAVTTNRLTP